MFADWQPGLAFCLVDHELRWVGSWLQAAAIFFCLCFILTNFVVLNVIIAVVLEQFAMTEGKKKERQRDQVFRALTKTQVGQMI